MTNESVSILSAESIMFGRGELIVLKFQNVQMKSIVIVSDWKF